MTEVFTEQVLKDSQNVEYLTTNWISRLPGSPMKQQTLETACITSTNSIQEKIIWMFVACVYNKNYLQICQVRWHLRLRTIQFCTEQNEEIYGEVGRFWNDNLFLGRVNHKSLIVSIVSMRQMTTQCAHSTTAIHHEMRREADKPKTRKKWEKICNVIIIRRSDRCTYRA